jgi:hypothetical protein
MRLGVDVGGTTVKVGFIDNYEIVDRLVVETKKETLFDDVFVAVKEYATKKNYKIDGIGVGLPGHVVGTVIDRLPNVGISNLDVKPIANKYFPGVFVACTNDANAAALGELLADDDKKAQQRQNERRIDGRKAKDALLVDNQALQRRHERTAHDGHHQEGRTQRGILVVNILKRDTIDSGEHERHEETNAHQAIEAYHANNTDSTERAEGSTTAKDSKQHAAVDKFH